MLSFPLLHPRRPRPRPQLPSAGPLPPVVAGPVLVAAVYDHFDPPSLVLTFDRPIEVSAYDGIFVVVGDGPINGRRYDGQGIPEPQLLAPAIVKIYLSEIANLSGAATTLTATPACGIAAADGSGPWGGAAAVGLPYP